MSDGHTVLVCGGRGFYNQLMVFSTLDEIHEKFTIGRIIAGGATGADNLAWIWARSKKISHQTYSAQWDKLGKAAGPIRNQRMLDEGKPDLVIAFPGGKGTADMVRRARAANVEVIEPLKTNPA